MVDIDLIFVLRTISAWHLAKPLAKVPACVVPDKSSMQILNLLANSIFQCFLSYLTSPISTFTFFFLQRKLNLTEGKFFMLRSCLSGLVLTIQDSILAQGQPVILHQSTGSDNQLWYEDRHSRAIRAKLDDNYCLEGGGMYYSKVS